MNPHQPKRYEDKIAWDYSIYEQGMYVICPKCKGMAIAKLQHGKHRPNCQVCLRALKCNSKRACRLDFRCTACGDIHSKRRKPIGALTARGECINCQRYFRVELDESKRGFNLLNTKCPHCDTVNTAKVHEAKGNGSNNYITYTYHDANEPVFNGYHLYFYASYKGSPVWAYNRQHLQYLIDFIEADVRDKPRGFLYIAKGLSIRLPKFMHLAKNRDGILKVLRRMQDM
ncbi:MAG: hypothetical protein FWC77_01850 [Defluviitaleaceae bacterium]|nr:hypothetical protein [Defluviitaleaceae bacterium]